MRLIDADALKKELKKLPLMINLVESFLPSLIDCQPTIEAEPVRQRRMAKKYICPTNGEACCECIPGAPCARKE